MQIPICKIGKETKEHDVLVFNKVEMNSSLSLIELLRTKQQEIRFDNRNNGNGLMEIKANSAFKLSLTLSWGST